MALKYTKETVSAGFVQVHPLGRLGDVVTPPLGRVSFHTENSSRHAGASVCVGSRHRLWGEAERTQPQPCPGRWGTWARRVASEPPVPPVK